MLTGAAYDTMHTFVLCESKVVALLLLPTVGTTFVLSAKTGAGRYANTCLDEGGPHEGVTAYEGVFVRR